MTARRTAGLAGWVALGAVACTTALPPAPPRSEPARRTAAERHRARGFRLVDETLQGRLDRRHEAEAELTLAYRLDPGDRTTARVLGRFLNLRLAENDFSRTDLQAEIYRDLATDTRDPTERYAFECFARVAGIAGAHRKGAWVRARRELRALEASLRERVDERPEEIDTSAMAGNYALALAGRLPWGRRRRLEAAISYLEHQQVHWHEQSVLARGLGVAPGTRAVFTFWLAESQLAVGDVRGASASYDAVIDLAGQTDATRAVRQLAGVAAERLADRSALAGDRRLVPVWPQGSASCVACHAWGAAIPSD